MNQKNTISFFVFALGIILGVGCKKDIDQEKKREPSFSLLSSDTLLDAPAKRASLYNARYVAGGENQTLVKATVEIVGNAGMVKNLAFSISSRPSGEINFFRNEASSLMNFTFPSGTTLTSYQECAVAISADVDGEHLSTVQVVVTLYYQTSSQMESKTLRGYLVRIHKTSMVVSLQKKDEVIVVTKKEQLPLLFYTVEGVGAQSVTTDVVITASPGESSAVESLSLVTSQGVIIGTAQNKSGTFSFSGLSFDNTGEKKYTIRPTYAPNVASGIRVFLKLEHITTKESVSGKVTTVTVAKQGDTHVLYYSRFSVNSLPLLDTKVADGEKVAYRFEVKAIGGPVALKQLLFKTLLANDGTGAGVSVKTPKLRVSGVVVPSSFSNQNGSEVGTISEQDTRMYATVMGEILVPEGQTIVIELLETLSGFAQIGDAISTILIVDDQLQSQENRYVSRISSSDKRVGLSRSPVISSDAVLYSTIWSDISSLSHTGIAGISSPDWQSGFGIEKKINAAVMQ